MYGFQAPDGINDEIFLGFHDSVSPWSNVDYDGDKITNWGIKNLMEMLPGLLFHPKQPISKEILPNGEC